jgi:hypothetical protein
MRGLHALGDLELFGTTFKPLVAVLEGTKGLLVDLFKSQTTAISPGDCLRQLENAKTIVRTILISAYVGPQPVIRAGLEELTMVNLTEAGGSLERQEGQHGLFANLFEAFYSAFLRTKITRTYYSLTLQTFRPVPGADLGFDAPAFVSRGALRGVVQLLGLPGLALLDVLAADVAAGLMETFGEKIKGFTPLGDIVMPYVESPAGLSDVDGYLRALTHISAVLRFRRLLREAAELRDVREPRFAYLSPLSPPQSDVVLTGRLGKTPILAAFNASTYPQFFGALMAHGYWTGLTYRKGDDAFLDNAHLLPHFHDELAAPSGRSGGDV